MLSKADSFPIKSIRTSGIEVKDNPSKNTQTHILGKKVKTKHKTNSRHRMKCTLLKDNFQCRPTKDQVTVLLVQKKKLLFQY